MNAIEKGILEGLGGKRCDGKGERFMEEHQFVIGESEFVDTVASVAGEIFIASVTV